jgi:hypothetical protein
MCDLVSYQLEPLFHYAKETHVDEEIFDGESRFRRHLDLDPILVLKAVSWSA